MRCAVVAMLLLACRYRFDPLPDAEQRPNLVFITSTIVESTFGDIANADAICQARADAVGIGGSFVALVGTQGTDVLARLQGSRGWVDVAGLPIVDMPSGWFDGHMFYPLRRDELAVASAPRNARIGDRYGDCAGWTTNALDDRSSIIITTEVFRLDGLTHECSGEDSLVCVELGHEFPLAVAPQTGRIAFTSSANFIVGGGLAAADAICASEAAAANLPGTYLAVLDSSAGSGFSRFSLTGPAWVRPDGIPLAPTAIDVAQAPFLDSFASFHADGTPVSAPTIWTGESMTCTDWTSQAGQGTRGVPDSVDHAKWRNFGDTPCTSQIGVLCLQQ